MKQSAGLATAFVATFATLRTLNSQQHSVYQAGMEIVRKWQSGKLPCPDPHDWLDYALQGFEILPITEPIARQAVSWDWSTAIPPTA